MVHPNGDIYYGYWLHEKAHGFGGIRILGQSDADMIRYVGYWAKDKPRSLSLGKLNDKVRNK